MVDFLRWNSILMINSRIIIICNLAEIFDANLFGEGTNDDLNDIHYLNCIRIEYTAIRDIRRIPESIFKHIDATGRPVRRCPCHLVTSRLIIKIL